MLLHLSNCVYEWTDWNDLLKKLSLFFFFLTRIHLLCYVDNMLSEAAFQIEEGSMSLLGPRGGRIKVPFIWEENVC